MDALCNGHASFFRCHRSYIVNMDKVTKVKGNSQGYRLCFNELHDTVPVARKMNEELKRKIRNSHKAARYWDAQKKMRTVLPAF
jgi:DNA-binding LytR/AlgR family response regulator